jgi:hypothetical protein
MLAKISSHFVCCLFSLVTGSFAMQKLLSLMQPYLSILSLNCWDTGVLLRKPLPMPICFSVFPIVSHSGFKVSALWSTLNFSSTWWKTGIWFQSSTGEYTVFPTPFVKGCLSSNTCFGVLCQKSNGYSCMGLRLGLLLCSIGLHVWFFCACNILFLFFKHFY